MSKPGLKTPKPETRDPKPTSPLPEAFINAHSGPVRACGEIALPVWEIYGGPKAEPAKR
ncbi:MAG: hypothetical protein AB1324_04060 [Candidatus Micrarchaeota archaeon]